MMRVILLGKAKHRAQPLFQSIVQRGTDLGHEVLMWDKKQFLASDLSDESNRFDLICLKSHFDVDAVWAKIETAGVVAINSRAASDHCLDRRRLDGLLKASGMLTPTSATAASDVANLSYPIMQKPVDAGDHDVQVLAHPPLEADCQRYFYQEMVPSDDGTVYKLYAIGASYLLVQEGKNGSRVNVALSEQLGACARRVREITGLSLFGADFMQHQGRYFLIDVNPFPGFRGVPQTAAVFWRYLESVQRAAYNQDTHQRKLLTFT